MTRCIGFLEERVLRFNDGFGMEILLISQAAQTS